MINCIGNKGILESIDDIHSVEDLKNFVKGLNYNDVKIVNMFDKKAVIVFDGTTVVENKKKLKEYFEETLIIPNRYYDEIYKLVETNGKTTELAIKINELIGFDNAKSFGTTLRVDNKDFRSKADALHYFYNLYDFESLKAKCEHWEELDNGKSILLDGIAYITTDSNLLNLDSKGYSMDVDSYKGKSMSINISEGNNNQYPLQGLLSVNGKIQWINTDKKFFRTVETDEGKLEKLYTLAEEGLCQFYREVKPYDVGVVRKPYPVAFIGEESIYAYKIVGKYKW